MAGSTLGIFKTRIFNAGICERKGLLALELEENTTELIVTGYNLKWDKVEQKPQEMKENGCHPWNKACSKRRATAVPNLNQFVAVSQQWFQTSNLIQSRQILKYRNR